MNFEKNKNIILNNLKKGIDKSKKGSIDEKIKDLINIINSKPNYYTTSSCSGRIMLYSKTKKKNNTKWLFVSHKTIKLNQIMNTIKQIPNQFSNEEIWFKQESFILHIIAKDLESAKKILNLCKINGIKRTGINSLGKRINLEIIYNLGFDTIIAKNGEILINQKYINTLTKKANEYLKKNIKKIEEIKVSFSTI